MANEIKIYNYMKQHVKNIVKMNAISQASNNLCIYCIYIKGK